eukprot:TRINITY_DN62855_c0_g1_i1.p2 TRINITY_DN62855_c0_g1~~TRINITY_DN62855_c0_g1_i1.p2  ORF type:complete len:230 (+),score=22.28 TRINITY_DN62855_c0_g1_i1:62-691(+)
MAVAGCCTLDDFEMTWSEETGSPGDNALPGAFGQMLQENWTQLAFFLDAPSLCALDSTAQACAHRAPSTEAELWAAHCHRHFPAMYSSVLSGSASCSPVSAGRRRSTSMRSQPYTTLGGFAPPARSLALPEDAFRQPADSMSLLQGGYHGITGCSSADASPAASCSTEDETPNWRSLFIRRCKRKAQWEEDKRIVAEERSKALAGLLPC